MNIKCSWQPQWQLLSKVNITEDGIKPHVIPDYIIRFYVGYVPPCKNPSEDKQL